MRILLCSSRGDGAWYVALLRGEGHEVDWTVKDEKYEGSLRGIIPQPLKRPNPSKYDLIVFDSSGSGAAADEARLVTPTIGSSQLADRLEDDRVFGFQAMEQAGIKVPRWEPFSDAGAAIAWLKKEKKRAVLKPIGDAPKDATYVSKSAEDMIRYIESRNNVKTFVLQEFIEGTEVSTEGWWDGHGWTAMNHTLEEKKLLVGGLGPNTGCAGNVLWMIEKPNALFQQGLDKIAPLLKATGFVGMIDLNTIVTEGDVYGLEWTPRFGYEGTCNLVALLPVEFGEFMFRVATRQRVVLPQPRAKFAATVSLSVPPYPNADLVAKAKLPRVPIQGLDLAKLSRFMLYDVVKEGDELFVEGNYMGLGAPIGTGANIGGAFAEVQSAIDYLDVPDLQYRNDIAKCVESRYVELQRNGWLRPIG